MTADHLDHFYTSNTFSDFNSTQVVRQPFTLEGLFWDKVSYDVYKVEEKDTVYLSQTTKAKGRTARFFPLIHGHGEHEAPVYFAGYGTPAPDYQKKNRRTSKPDPEMQNAWLMVFEPDPDHDMSRSAIVRHFSRKYGVHGVIFIPQEDPECWEQRALEMSRQLERPLVVRRQGELRHRTGRTATAAVAIQPELARDMLNLTTIAQLDSLRQHWMDNGSQMPPHKTAYHFRNTPVLNQRTFEEENIIAVVPGSDEKRKNEMVVLSAHYDHMGLGQPADDNDLIYSGADDNASGTAVLMQIAKAFHQAAKKGYQPSRTLIFLHLAAEEWGLLGARFYAENPLFPISDIAANVNVDMVGYVDNVYLHQEDPHYIYVIGGGMVSSELERLIREANEATANLSLDETYNDTGHPAQLYRRSDHWVFAQKNIPFVFFFSGLHDHYHRPSDTADRISYPLLARRAELITELVWYLAEIEKRPESDRKRLGSTGEPSR